MKLRRREFLQGLGAAVLGLLLPKGKATDNGGYVVPDAIAHELQQAVNDGQVEFRGSNAWRWVGQGGQDAPGRGLNPDDPMLTIDYALQHCAPGDTVMLLPGAESNGPIIADTPDISIIADIAGRVPESGRPGHRVLDNLGTVFEVTYVQGTPPSYSSAEWDRNDGETIWGWGNMPGPAVQMSSGEWRSRWVGVEAPSDHQPSFSWPEDDGGDVYEVAKAAHEHVAMSAEEALETFVDDMRKPLPPPGIEWNVEPGMLAYAAALGKDLDQLTTAERQQAFLNAVLERAERDA